MEVLTYSPKVWVYAACYKKDEFKYFDLSDDVVSCNVSRGVDAAATFSIVLQNKSGKYNQVFTPMDRVTIYASGANGKKYQLLTGYITKTDVFKLYQSDFSISGKCSIYRLERFYWDADLISSYEDFARNSTYMHESGAGIANLIRDLLVNVAGMDKSMIAIGDIPQSVIEWAQEMYESQFEDDERLRIAVGDFYKTLQEHGLKTSGQSSVGSGGGLAVDANVEKAVKWMIDKATNNYIEYSQLNRNVGNFNGLSYDCSSFVCTGFLYGGFDAIGLGATYTGNMRGAFEQLGFEWIPGSSFTDSQCKRGDILLNEAMHTEVYIGENQDVNCGTTPAGVCAHCVSYPWDGILRYTGKSD